MKPVVLLVDDDDEMLTLLSARIQTACPRAVVHQYASAEAALNFLKTNSVNAIVANHSLTDMETPKFVGAVRKAGVLGALYVITDQPSIATAALRAGASEAFGMSETKSLTNAVARFCA